MAKPFRRIRTILLKDLRDALRDARVLFAIITPLGIGIFYNFLFEDGEAVPVATVAISAGASTWFQSALVTSVGEVVDIEFDAMNETEVREIVASEVADLGVIIGPGFDAALTSGSSPPMTVIVPDGLSLGGEYVLASIDPTLRLMSGQTLPADLSVELAGKSSESISVFEDIGTRTYFVLFSVVMMIVMTGMMAIPIVLAEETEKKTIEALALIASHREIVVAKASLGVVYGGVATAILLVITRLFPNDWPMYIGAVTALGITVIGFGLLMAGVLRSASQLNTWSSLIVLPMISPAFLVGVGLSDQVERAAGLTPTGAAMTLFIESASKAPVFNDTIQSFAVILAWGVVAYLLLLWQLSRRRA
ncbi:hypothetical protein BH24CHL4_BH24CHL4_06390 [soil metagenome]